MMMPFCAYLYFFFTVILCRLFTLCLSIFFSLNSFETGGVGVGVKKGGREYY